jgi:Zn-finger nucleic acid-binding protein
METTRLKGVPIDSCPTHGVWLDTGELERLLENRERTMRAKYRRHLNQANRDGKLSGILFGWFSLLFDRGRPF